jgi:hypothetical protein
LDHRCVCSVIILGRNLLVGYWEIKVGNYKVLGTKNERNGLAWFLKWIWKLRVLTGEIGRRICFFYIEIRRVPFAYFLFAKKRQELKEKFMEKK